jgi:hypothetical protein
VLSGNANTYHAKFYNKGARHHENERQAQQQQQQQQQYHMNKTSTAPVHKKFVAKSNYCDNSFINRFIINNSTSPSCNNNNNNLNNNNIHYSLSLNRHIESRNSNNNVNLSGVGCKNGTLISPYAFTTSSTATLNGNGLERSRGGTKSDIGVPISSLSSSRKMMKSCAMKGNHNNNNFIHAGSKVNLPSVHSDLSIYEATFNQSHPNLPDVNKDILNNNISHHINADDNHSAIMSLTKTGSKLLYTNKHRLNSSNCHNRNDNPLTRKLYRTSNINNNNNNNNNYNCNDNNENNNNALGPLVYRNGGDDELAHNSCDWNNSVFDNPIMSVSNSLLL